MTHLCDRSPSGREQVKGSFFDPGLEVFTSHLWGLITGMIWGASSRSPSLKIGKQRPRLLGSTEQALPLGLVVWVHPSDLAQGLAHPKPKK